MSDGSIVSCHQTKALEYGSTIDPLTKLAFALEEHMKKGVTPIKILMVDQFGVLHAPFAQPRAYFAEGESSCFHLLNDRSHRDRNNPFARTRFLVHSIATASLEEVTIDLLCPLPPALF
jgi:hypothetical protein